MEVEYDPDLDQFFIVVPEKMIDNLGWEEGDMLEYEFDEEVLRVFKI